jgi:alpha-acetolactate decarboxylase
MKLRSACVLAFVCVGCRGATGTGPPAAERARASTEVRTYGALREIMHEGKTEPHAELASLPEGRHTYALGALSELRGEVTVLDDTIWLAYPNDDGTPRVRAEKASGERATLFVSAQVERWRRVRLERDLTPAEFDAHCEALAAAQGVDTSKPFPFRIDGTFRDLRWHVVDGRKLSAGGGHADHVRSAVSGTLPEASGTLVGFFSKAHQGVFTHMGSNSHLHVVATGAKVSGHVDAVTVPAGAEVSFPE